MSRTNAELATDLLHAALRVLSENGGSLASRDVIEKAGAIAKPTGDECQIYDSGNIRWKALLHLQSIGLVKAGFIQKRKGNWYLTEEGDEALKLSPKQLWQTMHKKYQAWKAGQPSKSTAPDISGDTKVEPLKTPTFSTEEVEALATKGIEEAIRALGPYDFQDLVAALLRGMGYHTPFVSPKGKDGGIDVIAYRDPLGTQAPAILCQVKHRPDSPAGIADVQRLMGALQLGKNVGLFITSGTFSNDARHAARTSHVHIELVDMTRFIELWIEHYNDMTEDDRALLRLRTIHVLAD
jgi:restriction system protein